MAKQHKDYDPAIKAGAVSDESDFAVTQGRIIIGDSDGAGTELDVSGSAKIMVGNATTGVMVDVSGDLTMSSAGAFTIGASKVLETMVVASAGVGGLFVKKYAQAVYDFAVDGGTEGTITLAATATIPDNALVTATHYDVITTLQSSSDAATIKLNLPTDGDLSTAVAISTGTTFDAGGHVAGDITPLAVKTTGARAIQIITAGAQNITAGKIIFHVEYFITV